MQHLCIQSQIKCVENGEVDGGQGDFSHVGNNSVNKCDNRLSDISIKSSIVNMLGHEFGINVILVVQGVPKI